MTWSADFHLFELELVAPGNQRPPDELIGGHHDENDGDDSADQRANVAGVGRGLDIAAEAGKLEVDPVQRKHLAGHESEPAAGDRDDGVPHQADGGVGHLKLPEALPGGIAIDARGLDHLARNGFQRRVETECEIPHLPGEDEQDDAHLNAQLMVREQRDHRQHHRRQKAEHGDGLQNVENRDHPCLNACIVGGDVSVSDGEDQAEKVSDADAHHGVERVERQRARTLEMGDAGTAVPIQ